MIEMFCNLNGSKVFYDCKKDLIIKTSVKECVYSNILSFCYTKNRYIHDNYPKFHENKHKIITTFFFIPNKNFPFSPENFYLEYAPTLCGSIYMEIIKLPEHINDYINIDPSLEFYLRKKVFFKFNNKKDLAKFKLIM